MGNLTQHAKNELKLAGFFDKDSDYGGMLGNAVMELIELFGKQGHSGSSANMVVNLFNKVARYKPLKPIMCTDDEWNNKIGKHSGRPECYQNNRLSAVFKEGEDGKPYYLDAIVWKGQEPHDTFSGTVEGIKSRQFIKIPFTPKTFYIDVVKHYDIENCEENEIVEGAGKYYYRIKDKKQLEEVFKYYLKK